MNLKTIEKQIVFYIVEILILDLITLDDSSPLSKSLD